jgi:hypothetical protein
MIYFGVTNDAYALAIQAGFMDMFPQDLVEAVFGGTWEKNERSRAPYTDSWCIKSGGISLYASPNLTHSCVEISGQGCERLIAMGKINRVLSGCAERVTRIDIACDIETLVMPTEFVEKTNHERMRSGGHVFSDTGETCYVGSQKSDRYARVYRYFSPHPRSHLLRVEHVFRKGYAKKVATELGSASMEGVVRASGVAFGWAHEIWQPSQVESADISIVLERGNTGRTVYWLINSAASAFKRLCNEGTIKDPEAFIRAYFLSE